MDDGRWLVALSLGAFAVAGRLAGSRGVARKHRRSRLPEPTDEVPRPKPQAQAVRPPARMSTRQQLGREVSTVPSPEEMLRSIERRDRLLMQVAPRIPTL